MTSAEQNDFLEHSQNLSSQKWKFCFDLSALIEADFKGLVLFQKAFFQRTVMVNGFRFVLGIF